MLIPLMTLLENEMAEFVNFHQVTLIELGQLYK